MRTGYSRNPAVVLVSEEEPLVRSLIELILASDGCTVLSGKTEIEVLGISRRYPKRIDLLISDVHMSGLQLVREIVAERPNLRVLLISQAPPSDTPFAYLPKPFTVEEFRAKVQSVLEGLFPQYQSRENP